MTPAKFSLGFRGYIASRPVNGMAYPHKVQNLVIRDYCQRKHLPYILSVTEVSIPNNYMTLNDLLRRLNRIDGVVFFSAFMLPNNPSLRTDLFTALHCQGKQFHAALEDIS